MLEYSFISLFNVILGLFLKKNIFTRAFDSSAVYGYDNEHMINVVARSSVQSIQPTHVHAHTHTSTSTAAGGSPNT